MTAPGRCYGPFDVKAPVPKYRRQACAELHDGPWQTSLLRDPQINARCHVLEMQQAYRRGYRGLGMCKYVYTPANPRDRGGDEARGQAGEHERAHDAADPGEYRSEADGQVEVDAPNGGH